MEDGDRRPLGYGTSLVHDDSAVHISSEAQAHDVSSHSRSANREGEAQGLRMVAGRWAALVAVGMMGVAGYHQAGLSSSLYNTASGECE